MSLVLDSSLLLPPTTVDPSIELTMHKPTHGALLRSLVRWQRVWA